MDLDGVDPIALDQIMAEWDESKMGGPRPKLIVIVPYVQSDRLLDHILICSTCSNPGGVTVPEARKREIYSICRKWDLLIVEDDPCEFTQSL
jgi:aromatic amino acid aminotransferase I